MDGSQSPIEAAVVEAAEIYCRALHTSDVDALDRIFHDAFRMVAVSAEGAYQDWTKAQFLDRVRARDPFPGAPAFEIYSVDIEGDDPSAPQMAWVKLSVTVPPRRFHDYLGFLRLDGAWRIVNKQYRIADGPAI